MLETMAFIVQKTFWIGKVKQQLNQQQKLNPIDLSSCQKVFEMQIVDLSLLVYRVYMSEAQMFHYCNAFLKFILIENVFGLNS